VIFPSNCITELGNYSMSHRETEMPEDQRSEAGRVGVKGEQVLQFGGS
jgi:hypothetical protein